MATQITSNKVTIAASDKDVFTYLSDFNNIKDLLPQDKISDWKATKDECSFKIQNAAVIPLVKDSVTEFSQINVVSGDKAPFPFTLKIYIKDMGDGKTEGYLDFSGEINAFLRMMVVTPLTNLFNYMAEKLQEKFG